jgi:transcriptional antiterminator
MVLSVSGIPVFLNHKHCCLGGKVVGSNKLLMNQYMLLMKVKATLKQIAKELNVSVSTVSKALNDSPEISDQTKIRSRNMQS